MNTKFNLLSHNSVYNSPPSCNVSRLSHDLSLPTILSFHTSFIRMTMQVWGFWQMEQSLQNCSAVIRMTMQVCCLYFIFIIFIDHCIVACHCIYVVLHCIYSLYHYLWPSRCLLHMLVLYAHNWRGLASHMSARILLYFDPYNKHTLSNWGGSRDSHPPCGLRCWVF